MATDRKAVEGRTFSFSKLWTEGKGGWPCQEKNEQGESCGKLSNVIQLSDQETARLNKALPDTLVNGKASGPEAAAFILQNEMGKVVCDQH